ncbi:MAG: hypothetical protein ACTTKO_06635 [Candidatus Limimorpha sp.]
MKRLFDFKTLIARRLNALFLIAFLPLSAFAQMSAFQEQPVPVYLNFGSGFGILQSYDAGASPLQYRGIAFNLQTGMSVEWKNFRFLCDLQTVGAMTRNSLQPILKYSAYACGIDGKLSVIHLLADRQQNRLRFWGGGALGSYFDLKFFPALMNASFCMSSFVNLNAEGRVEYDFSFGKYHEAETPWPWTAFGQLSLPLLSSVSRPGFAYMDNYTSSIQMAKTLFSSYQSRLKPLAGIATEIGLAYHLKNKNQIAFSYRWHYLSTGKTGYYRFDNSEHLINIVLLFNLN